MTAPEQHPCNPRLLRSEVKGWADAYDYPDNSGVIAAGDRAREQKFYTREDFLTVMRWKTRGRTEHLCEPESESDVQQASRRALTAPDERDAVSE